VATIELYKSVVEEFLPTPSKSHYLFNLRDISKVFQGLLQADKTYYDSKEVMIKLWVHECMVRLIPIFRSAVLVVDSKNYVLISIFQRVFHDRLIDNEDRNLFKGLVNNKLQSLLNTSWSSLFGGENAKAPLFTDFISEPVQSSDQKEPIRVYQEVVKRDEARKIMEEKLDELNQEVGVARTSSHAPFHFLNQSIFLLNCSFLLCSFATLIVSLTQRWSWCCSTMLSSIARASIVCCVRHVVT
jgi:dynein heavy chain